MKLIPQLIYKICVAFCMSLFSAAIFYSSFGDTSSLFFSHVTNISNMTYVIWTKDNGTTDSLVLRGGKAGFFRGEDEVDSSGRISSQRIAIEGQDIHLVWEADSNNGKLITFYPYSFSGTGVISTFFSNSSFPEMATSQSNVFVIWKDQNQGNGDIMMKRISKTYF